MATERELERAFLAKIQSELSAIRATLEVDNFIIDEWGVAASATVIPILRQYDGPIIITSILAVWPTTSTSAVINLGTPGRNIPLNPTSGFFNPQDLKIQLGIDDALRNLTIAPAGAAYINFIGYADRKTIDRQIR
jgi:hypothetical protein